MEEKEYKIPQHIAIIMDGNGRWAKKKHMPRNFGHSKGSQVVEKIGKAAYDMGVKYVTVYAFSTENWSRPQEEVNKLMELLHDYMKDCVKKSKRDNMRVRVIGDITRLDEELQKSIIELEEISKDNTGLNFQVALNYGGRDEITRAMRKIAAKVANGILKPEEITEEVVANHLDTASIPDPDLLIRTSGEQRLSNYLPWQLAYTEFYFTDVLWPDFDKKELQKAIDYYNGRERRFGGV
ncbi:MAG: isoprenyl transferase [Clostridiales bacterium]|nr:isoprenyl transferase [Clostridiales bacterium]